MFVFALVLLTNFNLFEEFSWKFVFLYLFKEYADEYADEYEEFDVLKLLQSFSFPVLLSLLKRLFYLYSIFFFF